VYLSDDPALDFARYDAEQAEWLKKLPTCQICGDAIQQERAFHKDGFWICHECYENNQRTVIDA
jgi:formylmethanofuran dehydrogenase subunit E